MRMNDAAVEAMAALALTGEEHPEKLVSNLQRTVERGIERRDQVLTWAGSRADSARATEHSGCLTGWETGHNWVPLEGFIGVHSNALYGLDKLTEAQERLLLRHGFDFLVKFSALARALDPPVPIRCILAGSEDSVTFRFHQIRPAENWDPDGPWSFRPEKLIVADLLPENT
jgi:hypothetical protein